MSANFNLNFNFNFNLPESNDYGNNEIDESEYTTLYH